MFLGSATAKSTREEVTDGLQAYYICFLKAWESFMPLHFVTM